MRPTTLATIALLLGTTIGCSSAEPKDEAAEADTDTDTDSDTDTDTDSDTDSDTDADSDTDTDTDTDSDTDTDTDTDTDADADTSDTASPADPDEQDTDEQGDDTGDTGTPEPECDPTAPFSVWISPDDSNSMSSPAVLRSLGRMGRLTPRAYEFFNYYTWDYEPAPAGQVRIHADLIADPDGPSGQYRLQIGLAGEARSTRESTNLVFSIDSSCSMSGQPMTNVKDSLSIIAGQLQAGDTVSIVKWSSAATVPLENHVVTGPNDATFLQQIRALTTGGGTDLHGGLVRAYQLAAASQSQNSIDRVVLMSDGGANIGVTTADLIAQKAGEADEDGIYLSGIGTGNPGTYHDDLMDAVTDKGKGASVFIDSQHEAQAILGDRFLEVFDVAARNVELNLTLPDGFEIVQTSAEAINTQREAIPPQHLAPNDAMVVHNVIKSCGTMDPTTAPVGIVVHWQDPHTFEHRQAELQTTLQQLLDGADSARVLKGRAVLESVAYAGQQTTPLQQAQQAVSDAQLLLPNDIDLADLARLVQLP